MVKKIKLVQGDDLLYRFFQDALAEEPELFSRLPEMLLTAMGIWLPLEVYEQLPVVLPWVVRDSSCRGNRANGIPDSWSSPNSDGFLRDDNSLVKALTRSLTISTPERGSLSGARMGRGFVACHVWRVVDDPALASRHPLLNTFVPNLVWLPSQVAKLTDREGSVVQKVLQSMAYSIYRDAPVLPQLQSVVEDAWALIPEPAYHLESPTKLNWFVPTSRFLLTRHGCIRTVASGLERIASGRPLSGKVITTRYTDGLPNVDAGKRADLLEFLRRFALTA